MMPDDQRRRGALDGAVSRYARALRQGRHLVRVDGKEASQIANYRRTAERAELRTAQLHRILNELDIPPIQFVPYRAFTLHLDRLIRQHSGTTLLTLARSAIDYWTAYGLRPDVLSAICETVFGLKMETRAAGLPVPSAPGTLEPLNPLSEV